MTSHQHQWKMLEMTLAEGEPACVRVECTGCGYRDAFAEDPTSVDLAKAYAAATITFTDIVGPGPDGPGWRELAAQQPDPGPVAERVARMAADALDKLQEIGAVTIADGPPLIPGIDVHLAPRYDSEDERREAIAHAELTAKVRHALEAEYDRQEALDYDDFGVDMQEMAAAAVDVFFDDLRSLPGN